MFVVCYKVQTDHLLVLMQAMDCDAVGIPLYSCSVALTLYTLSNMFDSEGLKKGSIILTRSSRPIQVL